MTLRDGISKINTTFKKGVNYRSGNIGEDLFDSLNLVLIQNKITTRPGKLKYSVKSLGSGIISLSQFIDQDSNRKLIAKSGPVLYADDGTGNFNLSGIKTNLTEGIKHDAVTINGRHIIALGSDGLFSYNGTTFAALGISTLPTAPTIADTGAGDLAAKDYSCRLTYVASGIGFESNGGSISATVNIEGEITVSDIPTSTHPLVNKVYVYLKNETDGGDYYYIGSVNNGTASFVFNDEITSTQIPPTTNAAPISGGGKYLTIYNTRLVYAGNDNYKNDIFFCNPDEPDGCDDTSTALRLYAPENGDVTAIATGLFSDSELNQYLVIFKKRSTHVYYEDLSGHGSFTTIDKKIGCVSHKTIHIKDGDVYFLSEMGWRRIKNGRMDSNTLAKGNIDDIFKTQGETFSVNKQNLSNAYSTYYGDLDSYMTWISEGTSTSFSKCYNYHFDINGFLPLSIPCSSAVTGENNNGEEVVFLGDNDGYVYHYNIKNERHDDGTVASFVLDVSRLDEDELEQAIESSIPVQMFQNWQPEADFSVSYNFRNLHIGAISDIDAVSNDLTIQAYVGFKRQVGYSDLLDLTAVESGFTLDISRLDVDVLADSRARIRGTIDLNKTGQNIMIGLSQDRKDATLQLLEWQLEFSANGNLN